MVTAMCNNGKEIIKRQKFSNNRGKVQLSQGLVEPVE